MSERADLSAENLRIASRVMRALALEVGEEFNRTSLLYQFLHIHPSPTLHGIATALEQRAVQVESIDGTIDKPKQ